MKRLEVDISKCTACGKCEIACSTTFFKEENRELSAIRVIVDSQGKPEQIKVCNQCGECIDICPTQAISKTPKGVVIVNKKLCVNCLSCVGFCPTLDMHVKRDDLTLFKCIACGACVKVCEPGALKIVEE